MGAIGEGVLHVQLELVDFPAREQVNQSLERGQGRDLVAADVEHDAAYAELGAVVDDEGGQVRPLGGEELAQGTDAVEMTGWVARHDTDAQRTDLEPISLHRSPTGDDFQVDVGRSAAADGPVAAG